MSGFFDWEAPTFDEKDKATNWSWETSAPGDAVEGVVVETSEIQDTDYYDRTIKRVDSKGNPKMVLIVVVSVADPTDDDNGLRAVWIRRPSALFTATADAVTAANAEDIEEGSFFRAEFTHYGDRVKLKDGTTSKPPKLFKVTYLPTPHDGVTPGPADFPEGLSQQALDALAELKKQGVKL